MSFEVKLPLFEGPFDLLLFFIERDELDIYDIPISKITEDFLTYIHQLEEMNIEVASEFIVVAATLMRIKAKMLLPRPVIDEDGNEIDPREVSELMTMDEENLGKEKRGNVIREIKKLAEVSNVEAELQDLDLYKLLKAFEKAMDTYIAESDQPTHTIVQFPYTIENQKEYILKELQNREKLSFTDVISSNPQKIAVIYNFLAILELLQSGLARISVGQGYNNFWLKAYGEKVSPGNI